MLFCLQIQASHNTDNNANNGPDKQQYTKLYEFFFPVVQTEVVSKYITPVIFLIKIMNIICNSPIYYLYAYPREKQ